MFEKKDPSNTPARKGIPAIIAVCAILVAVLSLRSQKLQESRIEELEEQNQMLSNEVNYLRQINAKELLDGK